MSQRWSASEDASLKRMVDSGVSRSDIGASINRSVDAVKARLKLLGILYDPTIARNLLLEGKRRWHVAASQRAKENLPNKILSRILEVDRGYGTNCWEWQGGITAAGYGFVSVNNKATLVHRLSYVAFAGAIPSGLCLDHLCRVRRCVNPAHLEPVTSAENIKRGIVGEVNRARMLARTHCKNGHPFSSENTARTANGRRQCISCRKAHARHSNGLRKMRGQGAIEGGRAFHFDSASNSISERDHG